LIDKTYFYLRLVLIPNCFLLVVSYEANTGQLYFNALTLYMVWYIVWNWSLPTHNTRCSKWKLNRGATQNICNYVCYIILYC